MEIKSLASELNTNSYPGRGIVLGQSDDANLQFVLISLWAEV